MMTKKVLVLSSGKTTHPGPTETGNSFISLAQTLPRAVETKDTTENDNVERSSPDYTFIAKELRAILKGNYQKDSSDDKESYALSAEDMQLLINDKKKKRNIDARVVVGNFASLINKLDRERQRNEGNFPRRVQVGYKRANLEGKEYDHWTAVDILITKDQLKVFYYDSAGDPSNLTMLKYTVMSIPNSEITICDDVEVENKLLAVQKDGESCSIFTLDHIFRMSEIVDLHEQVDKHRVQDSDYKNVYSLDPRHLPPVLVRNAQSNGFIKQWEQLNKDRLKEPVNKKGHTILDYVKFNSVLYPPAKKNINAGIQKKQLKYSERLQKLRAA